MVPRTTERWELTTHRDGIIFCDYTTRTQYHEVSLFLTNTMLVYIIEGIKIVHRPEGDLVLNPGQGFLAAKGDHLFSETFPENGIFRSLLFYFDDQVLLEVFRDLSLSVDSPPSVLKAPQFWVFTPEAHLITLFQTIPPYFQDQKLFPPSLVLGKIKEIFWLLAQTEEGQRNLSELYRGGSLLPRLREVVEENVTRGLEVEDLARLAGRSLSAFKRDFHQVYGQAPQRWFLSRKLMLAQSLLKQGEYNVTETANRCGFGNLSHFSKAYRKYWGYSPEDEKRTGMQRN